MPGEVVDSLAATAKLIDGSVPARVSRSPGSDQASFGGSAKDWEMVGVGWQVTHILGGDPSAATLTKLENGGVRFSVWHVEGIAVPQAR